MSSVCLGRHLDDGKAQASAGSRGIARSGLVGTEEPLEQARSVEIAEARAVINTDKSLKIARAVKA